MDGWVGTFWDLKHVGVTPDLDAILAQDREGSLFSPPCRALRGRLRRFGTPELGVGAARIGAWTPPLWRLRSADPTSVPGRLTSWLFGTPRIGAQIFRQTTAGAVETTRCYARQPDSFGAVCTACDRLELVCDQCRFRSVTWQERHAAYLDQGGHDTEDQVEISGWGDRSNPPHFQAATGQVPIEEVAAVLGLSVERTRELIIEQLSSSPQAAPDGSASCSSG